MIEAIALPAGFLALRRDGAVVAAAYGVLHDELLVCESVVVDAAMRGQGLARRMMTALFGWAAANGARAVCLQVVADNVAGRALYASLGFGTELYRGAGGDADAVNSGAGCRTTASAARVRWRARGTSPIASRSG